MELLVPPTDSNLKAYVEGFNGGSQEGHNWQEECGESQAIISVTSRTSQARFGTEQMTTQGSFN